MVQRTNHQHLPQEFDCCSPQSLKVQPLWGLYFLKSTVPGTVSTVPGDCKYRLLIRVGIATANSVILYLHVLKACTYSPRDCKYSPRGLYFSKSTVPGDCTYSPGDCKYRLLIRVGIGSLNSRWLYLHVLKACTYSPRGLYLQSRGLYF